jgi:hypothetical protein
MDPVKFHLKFRRNFGLEGIRPSGYSKESCSARLVTALPQDRLHAQVETLQTLSQPCLEQTLPPSTIGQWHLLPKRTKSAVDFLRNGPSCSFALVVTVEH